MTCEKMRSGDGRNPGSTPAAEPQSCPGRPPMTTLHQTKPSTREHVNEALPSLRYKTACICVDVYLCDVPHGVQQRLRVSSHRLHLSLIITTLLLREDNMKHRKIKATVGNN